MKPISLLLFLPSFIGPIAATTFQYGNNESISVGCHNACSQLSSLFPQHLYYPESDTNFSIWDAKQQATRPACRITPSNSTETAQVLSILTENTCHFSVKGGGHSRNPGDSNSIDGVTLDLNRLNTVSLASDGASARVGGGATSAQVYAALEPYNVSFVGGRVGQVGVVGFTIGGGTYPFANKYGWALDNVYEFEVVLANSSIVQASETVNPDLYFALRGGANNFGIVTALTVRTFSQSQIYISQPTWADNRSEEVLDEVYDLFTNPELTHDVDMGYDMYYLYDPERDEFVMSGTQRYETAMEHPPVFDAIDRIPTLSRSTSNATLANLTSSTPALGKTRHLFDTLSILPSREVLSMGLQIFREEVSAIRSVSGLAPNFICYPLPTKAIAYMQRRGGNALGINLDQPLFLILISTGWSNATDDTAVEIMTRNIVERTRSAANKIGVAHPYLYVNYAAAGRAGEVFAGYGEENLARLRSIQAELDPAGLFTTNGLWRGFMKLS